MNRQVIATKIVQFMTLDTSIVKSKYLKLIKEKLANDETVFLGIGDKYNNLKVIEDIDNVNSVFIAFDTFKYYNINTVSILCIKTKNENIRDIDRENKIIDNILRERY